MWLSSYPRTAEGIIGIPGGMAVFFSPGCWSFPQDWWRAVDVAAALLLVSVHFVHDHFGCYLSLLALRPESAPAVQEQSILVCHVQVYLGSVHLLGGWVVLFGAWVNRQSMIPFGFPIVPESPLR